MNPTSKARDTLRVYKMPAILLALLAIPGVNNHVWFNPHGLAIVGLVLVNCLPLCTIYVLVSLVRRYLAVPADGRTKLLKQAIGSLVLYLVLLIPASFIITASLNWGRPTDFVKWDPVVFYKLVTLPVGFLFPPYGMKNSETLEFWSLILRETILKP